MPALRVIADEMKRYGSCANVHRLRSPRRLARTRCGLPALARENRSTACAVAGNGMPGGGLGARRPVGSGRFKQIELLNRRGKCPAAICHNTQN
jgi:hypothetical protein